MQYADGTPAAFVNVKKDMKPPAVGATVLTGKARAAPLQAGDWVVLAPSFAANNGDGWCLGSLLSVPRKVGVVVFAPGAPRSPARADQRSVLVVAVDDPDKVYAFRSSWLERAFIDDVRVYALGDRVQLNIACCPDELLDSQFSGKCLGRSSQAVYGRVVGVGVVRRGLQRNVEVVAVGGASSGKVSLYPSHVLVPALRRTVLTDRDSAALEGVLRHFLSTHEVRV